MFVSDLHSMRDPVAKFTRSANTKSQTACGPETQSTADAKRCAYYGSASETLEKSSSAALTPISTQTKTNRNQ